MIKVYRRAAWRAALCTLPIGFVVAALGGCDAPKPQSAALDLSPIGSTVGAPLGTLDPTRTSSAVVAAGRSTQPTELARQEGRPATAGPPRNGRPGTATETSSGEFTLDYADTDLREIVRVVLGTMLHVNYTIDPAVQGTATLQTSAPLRREALLPVLAGVLAQNNASLVYQDGIYRVTPLTAGGAIAPLVGDDGPGTGSQVVPLRYASAARLATLLAPYVGDVGHVQADPVRNALIVSGTASMRQTLLDLIRVFDVDYLAGQSYALFSVHTGDPKQVAGDLEKLFREDSKGQPGSITIVPIERANAILVITAQPSYLDRAGRFIAQLDQAQLTSGRQLHVYYVQNGQAGDLQPVLQRAFSPQSSKGSGAPGSLPPGAEAAEIASPAPVGGASAGTATTGITTSPPMPTAGSASTTGLGQSPAPGSAPAQGSQPGDDLMSSSDSDTAAGPGANSDLVGREGGIRIIADRKKNALLVIATDAEYAMVEAALHKLDILPLQVLIEATIAEVTLNDQLQYGTQFFFASGRNSIGLTNATSGTTTLGSQIPNNQAFSGILAPEFPAFSIARTLGSAQFAIQALRSITDVRVVSSPKLLILDNEKARLQVGDLVPVITQSATSVTTAGAPVVNSVDYRETGVILTVRPRINAGGLVTLDLEQEVSDVVNTTSSTIDSPTFEQRKIRSRVVVQDGDTIALGGLIKDSKTIDHSGVPYLKDIPIIGPLFGTKTNTDARTELLVMITPRVVHDQRDARVLTEELRQKLAPVGQLLAPPAPEKLPGT